MFCIVVGLLLYVLLVVVCRVKNLINTKLKRILSRTLEQLGTNWEQFQQLPAEAVYPVFTKAVLDTLWARSALKFLKLKNSAKPKKKSR